MVRMQVVLVGIDADRVFAVFGGGRMVEAAIIEIVGHHVDRLNSSADPHNGTATDDPATAATAALVTADFHRFIVLFLSVQRLKSASPGDRLTFDQLDRKPDFGNGLLFVDQGEKRIERLSTQGFDRLADGGERRGQQFRKGHVVESDN